MTDKFYESFLHAFHLVLYLYSPISCINSAVQQSRELLPSIFSLWD